MDNRIDLSAIIIYYQKYEYDDIEKLYSVYKENLDKTGLNYELIYVIDGNMPQVMKNVRALAENNDKIKIIKLGRWFGDATSLQAGFDASEGELILTLPSFQQVDAEEIPKIVESLNDFDMIIGSLESLLMMQ